MITLEQWKEFLDWRNKEYDNKIEEYEKDYPIPQKRKRKFLFWTWEYQPERLHNPWYYSWLMEQVPKATIENCMMWFLNKDIKRGENIKYYKYEGLKSD